MKVTRYFTPDEANQMLPLIKVIVRDILEKGESLRELGSEGRGVSPRFKKALGEIAMLTQELEHLGCAYKDAGFQRGMVDFPAFINGQELLLCWESDEDSICHYHREDEGFAARRRIPPNWYANGRLPVAQNV